MICAIFPSQKYIKDKYFNTFSYRSEVVCHCIAMLLKKDCLQLYPLGDTCLFCMSSQNQLLKQGIYLI